MQKKFDDMVMRCEGMMRDVGFELPKGIKYSINKRLTSTLGRCIRKGTQYRIEIAHYVMEASVVSKDETQAMDTILHEMCHALPNGWSHGEIWKRYADKINRTYGYNISRLATLSDTEKMIMNKGKVMKLIICKSKACKFEIEKPNTSVYVREVGRYSCPVCGSRLEVI
jgi:hypothetical protein